MFYTQSQMKLHLASKNTIIAMHLQCILHKIEALLQPHYNEMQSRAKAISIFCRIRFR